MTNDYMCTVMATCWGLTAFMLNLAGQQIVSYFAIALGIVSVFAFERLKQ
jgi:hypothetical protein